MRSVCSILFEGISCQRRARIDSDVGASLKPVTVSAFQRHPSSSWRHSDTTTAICWPALGAGGEPTGSQNSAGRQLQRTTTAPECGPAIVPRKRTFFPLQPRQRCRSLLPELLLQKRARPLGRQVEDWRQTGPSLTATQAAGSKQRQSDRPAPDSNHRQWSRSAAGTRAQLPVAV